MKVANLAGALLCAATLFTAGFSAGCGIDEEVSSPEDPAFSVEEQAGTVWCSDKSWRVDFFNEPEMITRVGWLQCQCYQPQTRGGTVPGAYQRLAYEFTCSLD